ncbi:MAG: TIGR01777 family oxidoreductase [Marinilabiliaceae bacterium]
MNIAISGITGLIGQALSDDLLGKDHCVRGIVRQDFQYGVEHLAGKLEGMDAVVNLAGAPLLQRWTAANKKEILRSRVETTAALVAAMKQMASPPGVFISTSAVGIYDPYEVHDEYSEAYADDFPAEVCKAWEQEALKADPEKVRLNIVRLGVVLSNSGGALKKMLLPFRLGLGGKIGEGFQPMPFIHIKDLTKAIEWLITHPGEKGIFNLVAPQMVSNVEFTKALASVLRRPAFLTVPEFALKMVYGDAARILTKGQKVVPKRLPEDGFQFDYSDIHTALKDLLKK